MHGRLTVPDLNHDGGKIREDDESSEAGDVVLNMHQVKHDNAAVFVLSYCFAVVLLY